MGSRCTLQHCTNKYICLLISFRWNCSKCKPGCRETMSESKWRTHDGNSSAYIEYNLSSTSPSSRFALISPESAVAVWFRNNDSLGLLFSNSTPFTQINSRRHLLRWVSFIAARWTCVDEIDICLVSEKRRSVCFAMLQAAHCRQIIRHLFVINISQSDSRLIQLPIDRMISIFSLDRCVRHEWLTSLIKFELIFIRIHHSNWAPTDRRMMTISTQSNEYAWAQLNRKVTKIIIA